MQYFIDQDGRVRLAAPVASDNDPFAQAISEAMRQWRFTVPRREGQPVIALVRQTFTLRGA